MQREVLTHLHESHQGEVCTKQQARLTVNWPVMDNDIENLISSCKECYIHLPSNTKELIIMKPKPCHPFQELAGDLCSCAYRNYLNLADCLTDWPDIFPLTKYNSSSVGHYDQAIILPHWRTRDILVRQRSVIHDQCIPEFLQAMGIQPQDSNRVISTEQWQSRSDSEDHKKHNLGRMEWP